MKCWTGLEKSQAGIKIAGKNINNLRYSDGNTLRAENEGKLKIFLSGWKMRVKMQLKTQHSKNEDHGIWSHHFIAYRWENNGNSDRLYLGAPKSLWTVTGAMKLQDASSLDKHRQLIKKQRHCFAYKGLYIQSYGISNSHVWIWELDYKEGWQLKNWCWDRVKKYPLEAQEVPQLLSNFRNHQDVQVTSGTLESHPVGALDL